MSERRRSTWLANRIGRVGITGVSWNSISWVTSVDSVFSNGRRRTNAGSETTRSKIQGICLVSQRRVRGMMSVNTSQLVARDDWRRIFSYFRRFSTRRIEYSRFAIWWRNLLFLFDWFFEARARESREYWSQKISSRECHSPVSF